MADVMIPKYDGPDQSVTSEKASEMKAHLEAITRDFIVKPRVGTTSKTELSDTHAPFLKTAVACPARVHLPDSSTLSEAPGLPTVWS